MHPHVFTRLAWQPYDTIRTISESVLTEQDAEIPKRKETNEPPHDKCNKMSVRPAKTQISLGIRPVWLESSLSAWTKLGSLATHWAHSENSD